MGSFANSIFKVMLGWLQTAASAVWSAFTNENGNPLFTWIGRNWIWAAAILCVTGIAADLIIYIFRWRPYKVWKSFFTRSEDTNEGPEETPELHRTGQQMRSARRAPFATPVQSTSVQSEQRQETDEPQWQGEPADTAMEDLQKPGIKEGFVTDAPAINDSAELSSEETELTEREPAKPAFNESADAKPVRTGSAIKAGYSVPYDSPYRRPVQTATTKAVLEIVPEKKDYSAGIKDRSDPTPVAPRRRRRINVSELFNDPEEELRQFDAPQNLIDSRKAYRDPVYPRGWKKSEDERE